MDERRAGDELRDHPPDEGGAQERESIPADQDGPKVQRSEEELRAGAREREAGRVDVRKKVRTEREQVRVPKRREDVEVERVPGEGREAPEAEIGEEEIVMQIFEEEVVVSKRIVLKEEIRLRKEVVEEEEVVEVDLRKEEVDIEGTTGRGKSRGVEEYEGSKDE